MILVDANIWIDHLRLPDPHLASLIDIGLIQMHPYTIAEIGLGSLARRDEIIEQLGLFPSAQVVRHSEFMQYIKHNGLAGTGIGYVDSHLMATTTLIRGRLWTRDKRLVTQATRLGVAYAAPET